MATLIFYRRHNLEIELAGGHSTSHLDFSELLSTLSSHCQDGETYHQIVSLPSILADSCVALRCGPHVRWFAVFNACASSIFPQCLHRMSSTSLSSLCYHGWGFEVRELASPLLKVLSPPCLCYRSPCAAARCASGTKSSRLRSRLCWMRVQSQSWYQCLPLLPDTLLTD